MAPFKFNTLLIFLLALANAVFTPAFASSFEYGYTKSGFKYTKHKHSESSYQHAWCSAHRGIEEYENKDKTRVDCLTDYHAVEFDFANKWAESIGQALHYQKMTGKKAMVVLILENYHKQRKYFKRVERLSKIHNFDVEYVTGSILNAKKIKDDNGKVIAEKCPYVDCKCNRRKKTNR